MKETTMLHQPGEPLVVYRGTFAGQAVDLALTDGIIAPRTPCCHSSAKGSVNSPTGVCCRACYQPLDVAFGAAATLDSQNSLELLLARFSHPATDVHQAAVRVMAKARVNDPVCRTPEGRFTDA